MTYVILTGTVGADGTLAFDRVPVPFAAGAKVEVMVGLEEKLPPPPEGEFPLLGSVIFHPDYDPVAPAFDDDEWGDEP